MDNVTRLFKTSAFGFNRSDVINYIEKTRNDFYDYKIQTERTINELNEKIKELETALEAKESSSDEANVSGSIDFSSSVFQINEAADHLRETADKICDDIGDFLDKILASDKESINSEADIPASDTEQVVNEDTSSFDTDEDETDTCGFMHQFSQIISNTFTEKKEAPADASEKNDKTETGSILDGLLGSSVFTE